MFDVFVRFSYEDVKLGCRWPVVRDGHQADNLYIGNHDAKAGCYSEEEIGRVLAFVFRKMFNIAQVEVRAAFYEDEQESIPYGGERSSCPGDVAARDSF